MVLPLNNIQRNINLNAIGLRILARVTHKFNRFNLSPH